jgi:hypothetical protein
MASNTKFLIVPGIPFFDEHGVALLRILTDCGTESCGNSERHEYELYLAVEDIECSRSKTKGLQTIGSLERVDKTIRNESFRVAFCKKAYRSIEELWATWVSRSRNTTRSGSIKASGAMARPRCRLSAIASI